MPSDLELTEHVLLAEYSKLQNLSDSLIGILMKMKHLKTTAFGNLG